MQEILTADLVPPHKTGGEVMVATLNRYLPDPPMAELAKAFDDAFRIYNPELFPKGTPMPETYVCTKCGQPGSEKHCGACGSNQSHRFPETEVVDHHLRAFERTKTKVDAVPDGAPRSKVLTRLLNTHALNVRRLQALHALCVKAGSTFPLPDGAIQAAPPVETPPNEDE